MEWRAPEVCLDVTPEFDLVYVMVLLPVEGAFELELGWSSLAATYSRMPVTELLRV